MGEKNTESETASAQLRLFMKCLLTDLRALEQMLDDKMIESDRRRVGVEQELVLVDSSWRPCPQAAEVLEELDDPRFSTELARFNLEFNMPPLAFEGDCLHQIEDGLTQAVQRVREAAAKRDMRVLLTGILPTIAKSDLELTNLTPHPRYHALNDALRRLRGGAFELRFSGADELIVNHDSVMLEACNTSCQFHFQVAPGEFARLYNASQAIAGPVLAAAVNSPLLFGRRLWSETRIALFQQAIDTRKPGDHLQERLGRVSFGSDWISDSVLDIFREDVARFRVVLAMDIDEDPFSVLRDGGVPHLKALQLHNSTVYRWMRPCYGICDGKPHLRIENRVLPSGPTVMDEVANAAFWFGLIGGVVEQFGDITQTMRFDVAKHNFLSAARLGLQAQFGWVDGQTYSARDLICKELIPLADEGLRSSGIASADITRYLGIIEQRVSTGRTGAQWLVHSFDELKDRGGRGERLMALAAATCNRQTLGQPVHEWSPARIEESGQWQKSYMRVEQYMNTDTFTVHEDEVIDLVANLMDWAHIRHVPVEDEQNRLVGIISYRRLLRFLAHDIPHGRGDPVPARDIMQRDPITIAPETPTLEAIEIMRREKVACLPVVRDERLVGIVTERDFMGVAAQILEEQLRGS